MLFHKQFSRFVGGGGTALGSDSVPSGLPSLLADNQIQSRASDNLRRIMVVYQGPGGAPDLTGALYAFEQLSGRWYQVSASVTLTSGLASFFEVLAIANFDSMASAGLALALVVTGPGGEPAGEYTFSITPELRTRAVTDGSAPAGPAPPTTNLFARWRADTGVTLNGSDVESWTDSISGYVLQQLTASKQPPHNSSVAAFNNRATVGTTASGDHYMATTTNVDLSGTQQVHVFVVNRRPSTGVGTECIIEHGSTVGINPGNGWGLFGHNANGKHLLAKCLGDVGAAARRCEAAQIDSARLLEARFDKGLSTREAKPFVDGADAPNTDFANDNNGDNFSAETLHLFNRDDESAAGENEVAEILIYTSIQSGAALTQIYEYIEEYYGIPLVP